MHMRRLTSASNRPAYVARAIAISFFYRSGARRRPHSFPTRRSSDLAGVRPIAADHRIERAVTADFLIDDHVDVDVALDRKSTRLNSSHVEISYAVFCLKKRNGSQRTRREPPR